VPQIGLQLTIVRIYKLYSITYLLIYNQQSVTSDLLPWPFAMSTQHDVTALTSHKLPSTPIKMMVSRTIVILHVIFLIFASSELIRLTWLVSGRASSHSEIIIEPQIYLEIISIIILMTISRQI